MPKSPARFAPQQLMSVPASYGPPPGAGQHGSVYYAAPRLAGSSIVPSHGFSASSRGARRDGWGYAALTVAVIGAGLAWIPLLGLVFPTLAVFLGSTGLARVRSGAAVNKPAAVAGVLLGGVALVAAAVVLVVFIAGILSANAFRD